MDYANRHVVVVGLGGSVAAARYLAAHGARVSVADAKPSAERVAELRAFLPQAEVRSGDFSAQTFADADLLVLSPGGVPLKHPAVAAFRQAGGEVIGDIEVLARAIRGDGSKVIAITGSNGKSTVTSLVGHLRRRRPGRGGGRQYRPGGAGSAAGARASGKRPDVWVLELSSFQLNPHSRWRLMPPLY